MKKFLLSLLAICIVMAAMSFSVMAEADITLPEGITEDSFGENTVYDGEDFYPTMVKALEGIHLTGKSVLYCKPGADVGTMTHGHVCSTLTVYGNGAYVSAGEQEFEVDTYKWCHNGANACEGIVSDITLTVNALNGSGAWGQRTTTNTVNLVFNDCLNMSRIYITGTSGVNNVTLNNCSYTSNTGGNCKVYTNANGTVTLNNVDFSNTDVPVNLNHKVAGTQTIIISDCSFTNCGTAEYDYSAPIRVLSSVDGAASALTVSNTTFEGTVTNKLGQNADILLDYGVGTTEASVSETAANLTAEKVENVGTDSTVAATDSVTVENYSVVPKGTGAVEDPYLISNLEELKYFRDDVNAGNTYSGKYIKLTASIDLASEADWTPIGNGTNKFQGFFDGNGQTISNLTITSAPQYTGFFGYINDSAMTNTVTPCVQNLTITNANITGGQYTGTLAGQIFVGYIKDVTVSATVNGGKHTGGIVGHVYTRFDNCHFTGSVNSVNQSGGIAGAGDCRAYDCSVIGNITAEYWAGGIIGNGQEGTTAVNCYVKGDITANSNWYFGVGGIAGVGGHGYNGSTFSNNYFDGEVYLEGTKVDTPIVGFVNAGAEEMNTEVEENSWNTEKYPADLDVVIAAADMPSSSPTPEEHAAAAKETVTRNNNLVGSVADIQYVESGEVTIVEKSGVTPESISESFSGNENVDVTVNDGVITVTKYVAAINGVKFSSLQAAIDAAADGAEIDVIDNVALTAQDANPLMSPAYNRESYCGIYIPDDKAIVLDLNGYTVSYVDTYGDCDNVMILNLGNLTINDSVGGGKLTYKAVAGTTTYSYFYSTIFNCGTLTVNGGTIENTCETETDVTNAVDNHSRLSHEYGNDCILVVNGGTLNGAYYYAIRQYTHYFEGVNNRVTINDGIINGGIYMQHGDSWYYADPSKNRLNVDCQLTINGGVIDINTTPDAWGKIRSRLANPDNNAWSIAINGGLINVPVELLVQRGVYYENGVSGTTVPAEASGARNAEWLEANGGFISGGIFTDIGNAENPTMNLVSFLEEGYTFEENNGVYGVVIDPEQDVFEAAVNGKGYATFAEAFAAVEEGDTLTLLTDLELTTTLTLDKGFSFTFDANGKKITNNGATNTALMIGNTGHMDDATEADPTYTIANAVFDGWTTAHVVRVQGVNAVIDNCTFQNTNQTSGAAIVSFTYANGTVKNSLFQDNTAVLGIDFNSNSTKATSGSVTLTVENCEFINNNFTAIGALYYHRGAEATVTGCEFTDNTCALAPVFMGLDGKGAKVADSTFTNNTAANADTVFVEGACEISGIDESVLNAVAKIGNVYYGFISEALKGAQEGDTVQLLPGEIEEETIKMPAELKDVTILGAEGKATTIKNTTIMAADGNSISYEGLTFDGIVFDNSNIVLTGWRTNGAAFSDITVTNCEFKNIVRDTNQAAVHVNVDTNTEAVDGFTFTNNVINGVSGASNSGVYLQATGEILFDNNVISNVAFRPMIVSVSDKDGVADTLTITNNTFSGSPVGRLQALGTGSGTDNVELTVNENIFSDITDAQQICFWSFNEETTTNDFTDNYYSVDIAANPAKIYYNAAAENVEDLNDIGVYPLYTRLNEDGTIDRTSSIDAPVACIDGVYYNTVEGAAEANPDEEELVIDLNDDIVVSTELDLITVGATLNQGDYTIVLTGAGVITSPTPLNVVPDVDHALIVEGNDEIGYTYTVTTTKYNANIVNASGSGMYLQDTVIEITADAPAQGMRFDRWEVVSGGIRVKNIYASTTTFTMPANDVEIKALYKIDSTGSLGGGAVIRTVSVVASASEGGSITPTGSTQVNVGSDIVYIITPAAGYEIADVVVDGVSVGAVSEYAFRTVRAAHTISASFTKIEVAPESPFADVSADAWYFEDVMYAYENDLMIGTGDDVFSPDVALNRAMIVTILWRLEGSPIVDSDVDFTDVVADEWYSNAISWASKNGIVLGYGNDTFGPMDAVTREQAVAILHRYAIYKGADEAVTPMIPAYDYSVWFENDIIWADLSGLLDGFGSDMEDMTKEATRAEIAAMLRRFCQE